MSNCKKLYCLQIIRQLVLWFMAYLRTQKHVQFLITVIDQSMELDMVRWLPPKLAYQSDNLLEEVLTRLRDESEKEIAPHFLVIFCHLSAGSIQI
ncbi:hypothetical protein LSH36_104g03002 [Paralvinella palmiformis]|uniref:Uncharacterized protein n=1 Tax=Paralvinella palmiformis TaxID=53620 RepID=A0AAD9N9R0_9ANNE|nr:hypothetical protein LSH36_104g03002 [Paralvinella palmiformis]